MPTNTFVEKYRPKSFDEVVDQEDTIAQLKNILKSPNKPHMMFLGDPGTGKTTVAYCFARELFGDSWRDCIVELNASDERGIDMVRSQIKRLSRIKGKRIILLDEADNMTEDAQHALRRIMERSPDTIFILSGNYESNFIEPLKSRCSSFDFYRHRNQDVMKFLFKVCQSEGIEILPEAREGFVALVEEAEGDMRHALNDLEKLVTENKKITAKDVMALQKPKIASTVLNLALNGDFEKAKEVLQDALITKRYRYKGVIRDMYNSIDKIENRDVKIRIFGKLGEYEAYCIMGATPIVQLTSFLSWVWIAPRLKK